MNRVMLDLRKMYKHLYSPSAKEIQVVDVPRMRFLMVDGSGAPESSAFHDAIQTLYGLSYATKFGLKKEGIEYPVMAMEGLWWTGRAGKFDAQARDKWKWTLMILQPGPATSQRIKAAATEMRRKGRPVGAFRVDDLHEGRSAQIMHLGPYSTEAPTIEKIWTFMRENGYSPSGKHHEIYLGDPRRASPSRLRTIVRQPIR